MKFLHCSDLHVGRTIRQRSRAEEHRSVLNEIVYVAEDVRVDAILVTGDVFHDRKPSVESRTIVNEWLEKISEREMAVVIIPGNHDDANELAAIQPLGHRKQIYIISTYCPERFLRIGDGYATALPYTHPHSVRTSAESLELTQEERHLEYRQWISKATKKLFSHIPSATPAVLMMHPHILDAEMSGAETSNIFAIKSSDICPGWNYVALGHIHRAQKIAGALSPMYYAGSPLQMDFGENDIKTVNVVEVQTGKAASVKQYGLTSGKRCQRISGFVEDICEKVMNDQERNWTEAIITGVPSPEILAYLKSYDQVVSIKYADTTTIRDMRMRPPTRERTATEAFTEFLAHKGRNPDTEQDLIAMFEKLMSEEVG